MVRSNRPTMENYYNAIYFIALQLYTLSEDCLLIQSIRSGRDVIQLCSIQYMSHHGCSAQPITEIYFIALKNVHALRGSLIESINLIWQRCHSTMQYSIHIPSRSSNIHAL
ncbi:hypothetical protein GIB67_012761 [Kingdonia uniflora]|uniref:Uncharacterized protein n=1 Tax=Kingdonia uniflora TaxID=39325 RepID=A0A7J7NFR4_9MAGN|nr:hypothetical protein GIB67_012761 [Kingdonia uniflora]